MMPPRGYIRGQKPRPAGHRTSHYPRPGPGHAEPILYRHPLCRWLVTGPGGSFSGLGCGNCGERQALPPTSGEHTGVQTVAVRTALFLSILALVMVAAFYGFVW